MTLSSQSEDEEDASPSSHCFVENVATKSLLPHKIVDLSIDCEFEGSSSLLDESQTDTDVCARNDSSSDLVVSQGGEGSSSLFEDAEDDGRRLLTIGESLMRQGRYDECISVIGRISRGSGDACSRVCEEDVLHLKAVCHMEKRDTAVALATVAAALSHNSRHVPSLMTYAMLQKHVEKYEVALDMIERAYSCVVNDDGNTKVGCAIPSQASKDSVCQAYAVILTDAGTVEKVAGTGSTSWKEKYRKAIEVCPSHAPAHYNLGVAASEAGDEESALKHYEKAVELHPDYVEALVNMGVIFQGRGRLEDAVRVYERAYKVAPTIDIVVKNFAMGLQQRGTEIKAQGDVHKAIQLYEQSVSVNPVCVEALYNLGVAYSETGEVQKSMFAYHCALKLNPQCAHAHNNLGVLYRMQGQMELAKKSYEAALVAQPNFTQGLNNLAVMYTQQGFASMALNLLQAAIESDPTYAEAWNNLGVLQRDVGEAEKAVESYSKCCSIEPNNRNAGQNMLLGLNYIYDGNEECIYDAHVEWGERFQKIYTCMEPPSVEDRKAQHEKVRIGYVSGDLFIHSVSYFAEAPIKSHNMEIFDVVIYSVCSNPDQKSARLQTDVERVGGLWNHVAGLSEERLAQKIREDEIDILIDLTGHTANNRLGTFAMKPAPIQITWIGYPNTTGLKTIDYRITDSLCDPLDTKQKYTEELIRMENCFLCYTPCPTAPDVAPLPADTNGYITFGSFNALSKQTPTVIQTWCKILRSIPHSRLILKNKPFACDSVKQAFWNMFQRFGVCRDRVDLLPLTPRTDSHLEQYSMVDICLDPFPYAGTTTTAEALYMGVPCLTMKGKGHAHNVGVSILTNVGLGDEWIAKSTHEYIVKAQNAARDITSLRNLRSSLRHAMISSPFCDVAQFMQHFEQHLTNMWNKYTCESMQDSK